MQSSIKKNTVYNMIKTVASIIFPLVTYPYISRVLQPENVGKVNFGSSIVSYFLLAATLGVTTYAVRECSAVRDDKEKLEKTASEILSINIITMIISYAVLILCLIFVPKFENYRLLILIQSSVIFFAVIGADWLNTAMEDFGYITVRTVAFQFISLILMFIFVKKPEDYIIYSVIYMISSCGGNFCNIFYRRKYGKIHFVKDMNIKKHIPPIMGLFAMLLSQTIMGSIDTTMLGFMKSDYDVGLYSVASKITVITTQAISSITWVVMPKLSQGFNNKDYKSVNDVLNNTAGFMITLSFPCFAGLLMLSKEALLIVGGEEYLGSVSCLIVLAVGMVFDILLTDFWGNCVLLPSKREKRFTIACFVGMIVNVTGNYFLIPIYGITGAAVATAISKLVIGIIVSCKRDKNIKLNINFRMIAGVIIGSVVIIGICALIKCFNLGTILTTVFSVLVSVIVYFIIMILFKNEYVCGYVDSIKLRIKKFFEK